MSETMSVPPGLNEEILKDENLCRRYGPVVSAYNPKNSIGGIYNLSTKQWVLFYPIEPEQFADRVAKSIVVVEAGEERQPKPVSH